MGLELELEARRGATVRVKWFFQPYSTVFQSHSTIFCLKRIVLVIYCTKVEHAAYIEAGRRKTKEAGA